MVDIAINCNYTMCALVSKSGKCDYLLVRQEWFTKPEFIFCVSILEAGKSDLILFTWRKPFSRK